LEIKIIAVSSDLVNLTLNCEKMYKISIMVWSLLLRQRTVDPYQSWCLPVEVFQEMNLVVFTVQTVLYHILVKIFPPTL